MFMYICIYALACMSVCLPLRVVCCAVAFIYNNMFCDPENDVCYTAVDQFSGSCSALVHIICICICIRTCIFCILLVFVFLNLTCV